MKKVTNLEIVKLAEDKFIIRKKIVIFKFFGLYKKTKYIYDKGYYGFENHPIDWCKNLNEVIKYQKDLKNSKLRYKDIMSHVKDKVYPKEKLKEQVVFTSEVKKVNWKHKLKTDNLANKLF